ncbi:MAG: toprim domain-containing protein [Methylotenera sp.]|nr:toprim domain-containing protein [Methylotenera sp.]
MSNALNGTHYTTLPKTPSDSYSVIDQFRQAMQAAGIQYAGEIIADGRLHRFHIEGHSLCSKNGAYTLHLDGRPAGFFQDYKSGLSHKWKKLGGSCVSYALLKQIKETKLKHESEIRKKHTGAASKAIYIWSQSEPCKKQSNHAYLVKKRVQPHETRLYRDALVIPIHNEADQLVNLQFINPEGGKRFLSGGRKRGCFYIIGDLSEKILICEGFATGASLHEDSNQRVVIAFDAGNLLPVAKNIHELAPDSEIIICGDNDLSGIGQAKAREAALSIGGKVLIPPVAGQDWNDYLTGDSHA